MEIIKINPSGFCYGVVDATIIAKNASLDQTLPRPIYIIGMIVHNQQVTESFADLGIITLTGKNRLEILDQVDSGTVIFTAHGVAPQVYQKALQKNLTIIDATCPDVLITHQLIEQKIKAGYEIIYLGKKGHPEPEGVININLAKIHLISDQNDLAELKLKRLENFKKNKIFVTNQTTMSSIEVADLTNKIKEIYPQAEIQQETCQATKKRQLAIKNQATGCDLVLVVGDTRSNNTAQLTKIAKEQVQVSAHQIADVAEINLKWLRGVNRIAVSAGASTPSAVVHEVVKFLEQFDENNPLTWQHQSSITSLDILPKTNKIRDLTIKRQRKLVQLRKLN